MLGQTASGYLCGAQPYLNKFQAIIAKKTVNVKSSPNTRIVSSFLMQQKIKDRLVQMRISLNRVSPQKEKV